MEQLSHMEQLLHMEQLSRMEQLQEHSSRKRALPSGVQAVHHHSSCDTGYPKLFRRSF